MLKMVETTAKYSGKVRTCVQKACMAVCEHGGTAASEKYVFDRLCPFLFIFACFGASWGGFGHFAPKCPKSRFEKGTSAVEKIS